MLFHYDSRSATFCESNRFHFDAYETLPINTDHFHPISGHAKEWDVSFVGKATERRMEATATLKKKNLRFLWIEHGVSGRELARLFRSSKCVLNIHADHLPGLEPRVYLAASCGVPVLSDFLYTKEFPLSEMIYEENLTHILPDQIDAAVAHFDEKCATLGADWVANQVARASTSAFLARCLSTILRSR